MLHRVQPKPASPSHRDTIDLLCPPDMDVNGKKPGWRASKAAACRTHFEHVEWSRA